MGGGSGHAVGIDFESGRVAGQGLHCVGSGADSSVSVQKSKIGDYVMLAVQLFQFSVHRRRLILLTGLTFMAMC
jgi:hypothetical protein